MTAIPQRLARFLEPGPTRELALRLAATGHRAYLVGGSVRDAFLDVDTADIDVATDARPEEVEAVVEGWADAVWTQGRRFGTIGCRKAGERYEITTFRAEVYRPESRKPEVAYSDDVVTDLSRRDFTVNAMAMDLVEPDVVDPYGGLADLQARVLRTPLEPVVAFTDDPLRMLRAARFAATLGAEPVPELVEAVRDNRERLEIVSAERIREELSRLLLADDPTPGLWLVARTGLSDEFLPELNAMQLEQDPIHRHKDVLAHTIAVVAQSHAPPDSTLDPESSLLRLRLAALLHDVGKPKTRGFGPQGVTFHHHEVVGARMARERLGALRYPNDVADDVVELVYLHLRFHTYRMGWTDRAVRRYVRDAGRLLPELNALTRADCTTRNKKKAAALNRRMDELEARIAELREREELAAIRPALDGRQVMAHLGIGPGPTVGRALQHLLDLRLDEGPMDEAAGYAALDLWARDQGLEAGDGPRGG